MKQDEFERLEKQISEMEKMAKAESDKQMLQAIRAGVGIVERLVVALERIAANTAPDTVVCDEQF